MCFRCGLLLAARPLIWVRTHPGLQVWVPRPLIRVSIEPGSLGLCVWSAGLLIWVHTDPWHWAYGPGQSGC